MGIYLGNQYSLLNCFLSIPVFGIALIGMLIAGLYAAIRITFRKIAEQTKTLFAR